MTTDRHPARQSATPDLRLAALDAAIGHARACPIPHKLAALDVAVEALREVLHDQARRLAALEARA